MADENPYLSLSSDQEENPYMSAMQSPLPNHENFLQKAIRQYRGSDQMPSAGIGMLPTTGQEAQDVGGVAMRNFFDPGTHMLPINMGANMSDPAGSFKNQLGDQQLQDTFAPKTQYGKNLDFAAKASGPAMLGLDGVSAAGRGIKSFFSVGDLPKEIESTKGTIHDIINTGPQKVKQRVGDIFKDAQADFGERMGNMPGGFDSQLTTDHFYEALKRTADELGGASIPGSKGHAAMSMAEQLKQNPRSFYPKDIQAQAKSIMDNFGGDTLSKAKFYNHFTDILAQEAPELASIKSDYAPVFDIAKQSKQINKGTLKQVASDKIGPEQLGEMVQAQQMMGDEPNIIEQLSGAGKKLKDQQGQLQKIVGRQKAGKKAAIRIGSAVGIEELLRHLFKSSD